MTIWKIAANGRLAFHPAPSARGSWAGVLLLACWPMVMLVGGCGKAGPAVQPVEGIVLLDGKELGDATVGFTPADGAGLPAVGLTGPDGRFKLTSTGGGRPETGAVAGDYKVVIMKQEVEETQKQVEESTVPGPRTYVYPKQPKVTFIVPRGYERAESSGLSATVKRGKNRFRFELDSKFKGE